MFILVLVGLASNITLLFALWPLLMISGKWNEQPTGSRVSQNVYQYWRSREKHGAWHFSKKNEASNFTSFSTAWRLKRLIFPWNKTVNKVWETWKQGCNKNIFVMFWSCFKYLNMNSMEDKCDLCEITHWKFNLYLAFIKICFYLTESLIILRHALKGLNRNFTKVWKVRSLCMCPKGARVHDSSCIIMNAVLRLGLLPKRETLQRKKRQVI